MHRARPPAALDEDAWLLPHSSGLVRLDHHLQSQAPPAVLVSAASVRAAAESQPTSMTCPVWPEALGNRAPSRRRAQWRTEQCSRCARGGALVVGTPGRTELSRFRGRPMESQPETGGWLLTGLKGRRRAGRKQTGGLGRPKGARRWSAGRLQGQRSGGKGAALMKGCGIFWWLGGCRRWHLLRDEAFGAQPPLCGDGYSTASSSSLSKRELGGVCDSPFRVLPRSSEAYYSTVPYRV